LSQHAIDSGRPRPSQDCGQRQWCDPRRIDADLYKLATDLRLDIYVHNRPLNSLIIPNKRDFRLF